MATGVACPVPILQFLNNSGALNVGGSILTQVSGVNTPTYQDVGLTTPLPNPIVLNSRGEIADVSGNSRQLFLTPNIAYTFTIFDAAGNQIDQAPYVNGVQLNQAIIGALIFPQSAAELAAGVTPAVYFYPPGDIRRYGPALDGVTDDTAAVLRWLSVGGALTFPVAQTALIASAVTLSSNTTITAVKGATLKTATGGISLFSATNKTDISISGLKFVNTATTTPFAVVFAHCYFVGCTRPVVQDCEFTGMNCGAITFDGGTDHVAQNNNIYAGIYPAGQQQTSDIGLFGYTGDILRAVITGNRCYGGGNFGIALQNPYSAFYPRNCLVSGNRIGGTQLYGILHYMPSYASQNSYNQITDNFIENSQGVPTILGGAAGAGIYCVGAAAGGALIANNQVANCCVQSTTPSQATGGLCVSGTNGQIFFTASVGGATSGTLGTGGSPFANGNWNGATSSTWLATFTNGEQRLATLTNGATTCTWSGALSAGTILSATLAPYYNDPITVANNKISGMTQYDGIQISSSLGGGVALSGNTVNMAPGNTTGWALHIRNSSNVAVTGGVLVNQSNIATVFIENQIAVNNITLNGINVNGGGNVGGDGCIRIVGDGTHGIAGLTLNGLQVNPATGGAGTAAIYITTGAVTSGQISDCYANVVTMPALLIAACTGLRVSNNTFASTGTNTVTTSGNCAGGFFDKSNNVSGGLMNNGATGFHVDQFGAAAPGTGTWAKGDTVYNDFSATNVNSMFMCTVAGSPGTFVAHV